MILLAGVAMAAETGRCYTAEVPAPIILPNGDEYDAGKLRICMKIKLSPVEGLHETSVDGHPIGGFRSRLGTSEATGGGTYFVFSRAAGGRLVLEGYAVSQGDRLRTYYLGRGRVTTSWWSGLRAMNGDLRIAHEAVMRMASSTSRPNGDDAGTSSCGPNSNDPLSH